MKITMLISIKKVFLEQSLNILLVVMTILMIFNSTHKYLLEECNKFHIAFNYELFESPKIVKLQVKNFEKNNISEIAKIYLIIKCN